MAPSPALAVPPERHRSISALVTHLGQIDTDTVAFWLCTSSPESPRDISDPISVASAWINVQRRLSPRERHKLNILG